MRLQDGQVDEDDRHDAEDHQRPGNAGDMCRSREIKLGWCAGLGLALTSATSCRPNLVANLPHDSEPPVDPV
jgi:hypothetical protein